MAKKVRFTIYDKMADDGVFDKNPANAGARAEDGTVLYSGPVAYPKMLYHPKGEFRVLTPAEPVMTPAGVKYVGEQKELIWRLAGDAAEETELVAAGWHLHPAKAIEAGGGTPPPMGGTAQIESLEAQLADLQRQLADRDRLIAGGAGTNRKAAG